MSGSLLSGSHFRKDCPTLQSSHVDPRTSGGEHIFENQLIVNLVQKTQVSQQLEVISGGFLVNASLL